MKKTDGMGRAELLARIDELEAQKDGAYAERDRCVALIAAAARKLGHTVGLAEHSPDDASWDPEWRNIVFVELPAGQVSWHIHDSERPWFAELSTYKTPWDGHTTEEKYARLEATVRQWFAETSTICEWCDGHGATMPTQSDPLGDRCLKCDGTGIQPTTSTEDRLTDEDKAILNRPIEEIDAGLQSAGIDPVELGKRGVAFVEKLKANRGASEATHVLAQWIVNHPSTLRDHGCARCVPDGEILVPGFTCAQHLAADIVAGRGTNSATTVETCPIIFQPKDEWAMRHCERQKGHAGDCGPLGPDVRPTSATDAALLERMKAATGVSDAEAREALIEGRALAAAMVEAFRPSDAPPLTLEDFDFTTPMQRAREALTKIGEMVEHDSPAYCEAQSALPWLDNDRPDYPTTEDVIDAVTMIARIDSVLDSVRDGDVFADAVRADLLKSVRRILANVAKQKRSTDHG